MTDQTLRIYLFLIGTKIYHRADKNNAFSNFKFSRSIINLSNRKWFFLKNSKSRFSRATLTNVTSNFVHFWLTLFIYALLSPPHWKNIGDRWKKIPPFSIRTPWDKFLAHIANSHFHKIFVQKYCIFRQKRAKNDQFVQPENLEIDRTPKFCIHQYGIHRGLISNQNWSFSWMPNLLIQCYQSYNTDNFISWKL